MLKVEDSAQTDDNSRPSLEQWSTFIPSSKKDDVVFFRMDTPSQLENEYEFGPVLGEGTFGIVFRGIRKKDNAKCAIKKILRERTFSASERARLDREISILRLVRHPGIIELYAVAESPSILFLITELCEGSSLAHCLENLPSKTGLEENVVVEILRQVTAALSYLHNRGIIHRDLKPCNIMLLHKVNLSYRKLSCDKPTTKDSRSDLEAYNARKIINVRSVPVITDVDLTQVQRNPQNRGLSRPRYLRGSGKHPASASSLLTQAPEDRARRYAPSAPTSANGVSRPTHTSPLPLQIRTKIIDFGLAIEVRKNEEPLGNPCGTPLYMAPEVLSGRSYTRQCDVWSLGILTYQLLTRQIPFTAQTEEQLLEQMNASEIRSHILSLRYITPLAQSCLLRILHMDPAYRYSASELLLDPWISQFGTSNCDEADSRGQCSTEIQNEKLTRGSLTKFPVDVSVSGAAVAGVPSRPPSVGLGNSGSTFSATNVLELMKQYHKELATSRAEISQKTRTDSTSM
ncbi:hypothetical protein T265_11827 [Opisthorchis viverrini]|uniref:Protein kinase domain-containing protein n=1 Tax=Opisthorchis viverrini TaxID=6198 RepID=A0A074YXI8_OPIVI|nr:hypothetical protein T265_11827 [Opisthorchis viverrini]KER19378.1 hypothetical protein T265_11827 [Opisthorchis viverrini]